MTLLVPLDSELRVVEQSALSDATGSNLEALSSNIRLATRATAEKRVRLAQLATIIRFGVHH